MIKLNYYDVKKLLLTKFKKHMVDGFMRRRKSMISDMIELQPSDTSLLDAHLQVKHFISTFPGVNDHVMPKATNIENKTHAHGKV